MSEEAKILGINRRWYPTQASVVGHPAIFIDGLGSVDQSENPPPTLTVLVEGDIGDYAAYTGHGDPQWVAAHGDKISFAEACCHFPGGQLVKEKYRD